MAARGLGVALAMQPYVDEDLAAGLLISPLPRHAVPAPGDWHLAYLGAHRRLKKIAAFQSWLIEEIRADPSLESSRRASRSN